MQKRVRLDAIETKRYIIVKQIDVWKCGVLMSEGSTVYLITCLLTYLLTSWSRVLLEKLTGSQLVKKFPAFYETQRFTTAFTRACHLSLS
jgi:hypothetical protein